MKHPVLFGFFYVATPLMILMRIIEQFFFMDQQTGFFKPQFALIGSIITYTCYALMVVLCGMALFGKKQAFRFADKQLGLCVGSTFACLLLLVGSLLECFNGYPVVGMLGILSAIVLAVFAFCKASGARFGGGMMIVLPLYALLRLLLYFSRGRGEVTVTYMAFEVLTMTVIAVFSLCFAKAVNGLLTKGGVALFYASALLCVFLACSQGLIPLLAKFFSISLHGTPGIEVTYLAFAVLGLTAAHAADRPDLEEF